MRTLAISLVLLAACHAVAPVAAPAPGYAVSHLALAAPSADGVGIDYLLYDPRTRTVWVPAGNTGAVDVIDTATQQIARVSGWPTKSMERHGKTRVVGPSAATLGDDGAVYIGSRGDSSVCAVADATLTKGACATLDAMPDGVAYVAATHQVWVTTPRDNSLRVLDATTLAPVAKITLADGPEGYAVDNAHGRFFTNVGGATLAIDLTSRATVDQWPTCPGGEAQGLHFDPATGLLLVACGTGIEIRDPAAHGAVRGTLATGEGVDDLDYNPATHLIYAAAGKAGTLTIGKLEATGAATPVASVPTAAGARNGVVDGAGRVYASHSIASELIVVTPH